MKQHLHKINNEIRQILFQDKTREIRAFHALRHFKRSGKIHPLKPELVQIQTHSFCNGRCLYCPSPDMSKKRKQGKMEDRLIDKIAEDLRNWNMNGEVAFMLQNEPLLDKHFTQHIHRFKSRNPEITTATVTNGTLLSLSMIN